jgi:hypothetical protein
VAERLSYLYVDEEIIGRAAAKGGIHRGEVADEERRRSLVARLLDGIAQGGGGGAWTLSGSLPPSTGEELSSADVRALILETIEQTAARGNVVIVAHAASHAIRGGPEVLRVLVTASPATRVARIGDLQGLDQAGAARAVKESDAARRDYLKRFYDLSEELPTQYDLVVNTDVLSVERAAHLISEASS